MHNVTVAFAVLLVMLLSYFFGCFNGSFMVSHFIIRDDVRKHGSGNAGLTNFYRTYGAKYALLVIACDMGKTVAACLLGSFFFRCLGWDGTLGTLLAGLGCELGHIFPVFYGLRGGKGILSGGVLVLGLLHPYTAQEGSEGRRRSVEQVKEFQRRFTQQFHLLNCRELLAERGLHPTPTAQAVGADDHCGTLIVSAVELLCDYLAELDGQK